MTITNEAKNGFCESWNIYQISYDFLCRFCALTETHPCPEPDATSAKMLNTRES